MIFFYLGRLLALPKNTHRLTGLAPAETIGRFSIHLQLSLKEMSFEYIGCKNTSSGFLESNVGKQALKTAAMSGHNLEEQTFKYKL